MSVSIDYTGGVFQANKAKKVGTVTAGTGPYNLASASYDSVSFSVASQEATPFGLFFKSDGTKMYITGWTSPPAVAEYDLSTAFDISTASHVQDFGVGSQETNPTGVFFKDDGTKMYVVGQANDNVNEYNLSTAWNISTASYSQNFSVASQDVTPRGLYFNNNGTKFFITGSVGDDVSEYSLSTAWDISTASFTTDFNFTSQETNSTALSFNSDGTKMYIIGYTNDTVFEYNLSTAFDVSTASYNSVSFSVASQDTAPAGITFNNTGTKMYIIGQTNDTIYQYSTGTATTLDLSTGNYFSHTPSVNTVFAFSNPPASGTAAGFALALTGGNAAETYDLANASYDSVSFSVATQEGLSEDLFFKSDGTKLYVLGNGNDTVFQYSLSTAWDISTSSYDSVSFSVASQETTPTGLFFKPDGAKMYIIGTDGNDVNEYNLSTAWDVSTASYSQNFSVATQDTLPNNLFFKSDGTKLYVLGHFGDNVYEYNLSTAWDISTASYSQNFSVATQDSIPEGLFFSADGTKMFIVGRSTDSVYEYSLSTAWDVSTASYSSISFSVTSQAAVPQGLFFKSDGTKMYVIDPNADAVFQYSTGSTSTATFTYPSAVKFPSGTAPAGPAIDETDVLVFYTDDGGTTYQGFRAGDAMA